VSDCAPVAVNPDGWTEWLHPRPDTRAEGFRMKCCDCGLVHVAQFAIVPAENDGTSMIFNEGETAAGVVIMRMRREDGR
jgi:hypothetical protein